jgi:ATP-dependent Clp protease, protease subunit
VPILWSDLVTKQGPPSVVPGTETEAEKEKNYDWKDTLDKTMVDSRTVLISDEIGIAMAKDVVKRLVYLSTQSKEPIRVIVNSVGGEVYAGFLIYDTIRDLIAKGITVDTEARGLAASMGSIILQAGVKRYATARTRVLVHEVSTFTWGKTSEMEDETRELRTLNDSLLQIIAKRSGKTLEEWKSIVKKTDKWFSAQESKDFGLVDEVLDY